MKCVTLLFWRLIIAFGRCAVNRKLIKVKQWLNTLTGKAVCKNTRKEWQVSFFFNMMPSYCTLPKLFSSSKKHKISSNSFNYVVSLNFPNSLSWDGKIILDFKQNEQSKNSIKFFEEPKSMLKMWLFYMSSQLSILFETITHYKQLYL